MLNFPPFLSKKDIIYVIYYCSLFILYLFIDILDYSTTFTTRQKYLVSTSVWPMIAGVLNSIFRQVLSVEAAAAGVQRVESAVGIAY